MSGIFARYKSDKKPEHGHKSVHRQLATVKGCAQYSAKRSKRVGLNIRNQLMPQCSTGISSAQNAYSEDQYNTSHGPHSRSNQIGARAVSIKHQGQWARDARALTLLSSTLIIV
ncbi:hypothetical protein M9H77_24049 [Catharanthus roseus]|uniref:Uncharacterized protein n=1 Tax=Catharanthus roseus TaxID=4058 RepID=A0ACC0AZ58_CATRO|nr:hypothetical protein M9H77_00234 [Catharanthus roseus]KAI5664726.1 hypothetical protein M9H77_24049 [Catharanthus roseus]